MRVEESLAAKKRLVEGELDRVLSKEDSLLFRAMRYAVFSGGKRFRPLLLLSSGACFGGRRRVLLPFACALELVHNYSLIHDDLPAMDNDDFRRGRPSCHKAFGENIALLAGDGLLTLAFELMAGANVPPELVQRKQQALRTVSRAAGVSGMIGGQFLDITLNPEKLTGEVLEELVTKKTGALIAASVEVGAVLAGAGRRERKAIADFGRYLGLAFQVRDDILDSGKKGAKKGPRRPDYAAFLGVDKAKRRLEELVHKAVASLDKASLRAEELRYLALSLVARKPEESYG
ncbi:MAG: polyprenyl synthetase family protein [Clostridiales bacterium]|nr:polyprenyl synthetase family protein [Clostridiales bacterium]